MENEYQDAVTKALTAARKAVREYYPETAGTVAADLLDEVDETLVDIEDSWRSMVDRVNG